MGNRSSKDQLTTLHENWITTTEPQSQLLPHINLYRSRLLMNTITHDYIEEYMVHFISEEDYLHYLKQTGWRQGLQHREPTAYILPIRAFINTSTSQLCTNSHTACIYFDKVEMRLTDINDIPLLDAMYMLRVCLEGFGMLKEHFGVFSINQDMVFINQEGQVKVWIHANLSSVIPNRQQKYFPSEKQLKKQFQTPLTKNQKTTANTRQLHEQSYNTENSYQNPYKYPQPFESQENTYLFPEISQQSMINQILGIVEENIDKETLGGKKLFSQFVKDRIRFVGSGNQTTRNRVPRTNVINSRYNDNNSQQGSQKIKNRKNYTFPVILQLYKQFIQQHNINLPRRMQVIHNIYQNKEQGGGNNINGIRNDNSSNSNSHSNNSNKNSLHNSQTINQYQANTKKLANTMNSLNNPNNTNNNGIAYKQRNPVGTDTKFSSGDIIAPVGNANVMKINNTSENWKVHNNSLFQGKFDQSNVTHIGNKMQNKLSLDSRNTGANKFGMKSSNTPTPATNINTNNTNTNNHTNINSITNTPSRQNPNHHHHHNTNNSSNLSYQSRSELNNSLTVVQIDGNLHYNLYSASNVTTMFPINNNNNNNTANNNTVGVSQSNNLKSLNNSRMNGNQLGNVGHANKMANVNSNTNGNIYMNENNTNITTNTGNTIYNAIKIKNNKNSRTNMVQNRRLATQGSQHNINQSINKNNHNIISHPIDTKSRNSSIQLNKIQGISHQPYPHQQSQKASILNYSRLQHQNNMGAHGSGSQNSSISSTANNNLSQMRNKIGTHSGGNVRMNPLSNNSSGANMHVNQNKKQSEDKMVKYHSPLSTLLEQKYDHGSKIIRTNQNIYHPIQGTMNPNIKNGYYRHTSNQSTKIQPKLTSINSNSNINAIKYVKAPYVANTKQEIQLNNSPFVTKPNSVHIAKNHDFVSSNAYVEKYIRDAHQPTGTGMPVTQVQTSTSVPVYSGLSSPNRPVISYQALNQTPYSHRTTTQQNQPATRSAYTNRQLIGKTRQEKEQKSQDKQVRYYTSNQTYELDSQIAYDLADVNQADI